MRISWAIGFVVAVAWTAPVSASPTDCGGRVHAKDGKRLLYVEKAEASCPWPYTTDKIVLGCEGPAAAGALYAITEDGRTFAVNGLARSRLKIPVMDPIWAFREDVPSARVDDTKWANAARALCH